ncbi:hypothetical protein BVY04_02825 [bacterium M21]|nr:hypothetical protein BVY04_02825 [bacterium M21]
MSAVQLEINLEFTPNPMTLKYVFSQPLKVEGSNYYLSKEEAEKYSPMANRLFDVDTVGAVMICQEFISVTYSDRNTMREAHEAVINAIKEQLEACDTVCLPREDSGVEDADEMVTKIQAIIESDIRPSLAADGGDINFIRYKDSIVYVTMMGACSGCPHAQMTLKNGVLTRLQADLPEIEDIVSI